VNQSKKQKYAAYGNRKGCRLFTKSILPIITEIITPGQKISSLYRALLPICEQRNIKAPSAKTLGRMVQENGLTAVKRRNYITTTIKITLDVNVNHPLACLNQLTNQILSSAAIKDEVKQLAIEQLRYFDAIARRQSPLALPRLLSEDEVRLLSRLKAGQHKHQSARATALLMVGDGASMFDVVRETGHHPGTILNWIKLFAERGPDFIVSKVHYPERTCRIQQRQIRIVDIIHTPPCTFNINRTTWNYSSITAAYSQLYAEHISKKTVERVVKAARYTWRRGRKVLTSPDTEYRNKVERLLDVLGALRGDEKFFFIDEVGPYRVRKYGGISLKPEDGEIIEEVSHEKSRGKVQFVAALDAVANQMTWIFTENKKSQSIISLLDQLARDHRAAKNIFLTWDAVSMHKSSEVTKWLESHNCQEDRPHITVVPLPTNAQFLNVIEAVFGGMKKAVICNSDYPNAQDMKQAIDRHFEERNTFFQLNPKRAGNKIWDKQAFDFDKLAGGLFRRM
jgi:hypothetical protein